MTNWTTYSLLIAGIVGLGCTRHSSTTNSLSIAKPALTVAPVAVDSAKQDDDKASEPVAGTVHGANKKIVHPVSILVDGVQAAVMRTGEMPANLELHDNALEGQPQKLYYSFAEYLTKIGVPVSRIKAIHMVGPRDHIASIEGTELRAQPNRFLFDFSHAMSGQPVVAWSTTGMKNQFRIDAIRHITVYVDQDPPVVDSKRHCYLGTDEQCAPAYDAKDIVAKGKGTRVYIDGKLAGNVKRKLVDPEGTEGSHSLGEYLATLGADLKSIKSVDFVGNDSVYARTTTQTFNATADLSFSLPRHSHGRIVVNLPSSVLKAGATADRQLPITSIHIFKKAAPSGRPVVEVTDAVAASLSQLGNKQTDGESHESNDDEI